MTSLENADLSFIFQKISFNVQINTKEMKFFKCMGQLI